MTKHVPTGIEEIVCDDIARRQAFGIAKYGQTVANNPLDLRSWLNHAYEESLDFAIYLRRSIADIDDQRELGLPPLPTESAFARLDGL